MRFFRTSAIDAGFTYAMDAGTARRQFVLSLAVMVGVALAITAALFNTASLPVTAQKSYAVTIPMVPLHAETDRQHLPRG